MPSKTLKTRATKSSTKSSSGSSSGTAAGTRATPRAATRKATSPGAATRKATSPGATSPRATSPGVATRKATSPRAAAAFAAAVAAKDTNRFHNLPVDIQTEIMRMARERKKNSKGKYELYKKIYYNRQVFMDWLDEIKRDGVDDKMRVRNPLREGSMIYTNKNGLYSKLWHLCIQIFQGDYNIRGVPEPVKRYYKKAQLKFFNKPPQ
jgi:hypothetical protein